MRPIQHFCWAWLGNAFAILALAFSQCATAQSMRVHVIDVGQGAATLFEFPCAAVLVDTGGESSGKGTAAAFDSNLQLITYLDSFFDRRADLNQTFHTLILTHPHSDHTLGVKSVLERYRVSNAITNGREVGSGRHGQIALHKRVAAGEQTPDDSTDDIALYPIWKEDVPAGGLASPEITGTGCSTVQPSLTYLWGSLATRGAWPKGEYDNGNNHSVVVRVDYGKASMLITGDLEAHALNELVGLHANSKILDVDVYQVGHHGSHNGTTDALLRVMTPDIAVIATGPADRKAKWSAYQYGHPRSQVVDLLAKRVRLARAPILVPVASGTKKFATREVSKAIYATGWDGTILLEGRSTGGWKVIDEDHDEEMPEQPRINLNTATAEQLESLPMIGPARARAIIAERQTNGAYTSAEDLRRIRGIGASTVRALKRLVTP